MSGLLTHLEIHPLTPERWGDFETLFGPHGAYGGCWCMWWRLSRSEFSRQQDEGRRQGFKALVDSGAPTGLLAYLDGQPVGWIALAPREDYAALERSRVLKRVDDQPVWSIVCFYVQRKLRRKGMMTALVEAALAHAAAHGARIVEAYPHDTDGNAPPVTTYMGNAEVFRKAGFVEVARVGPKHPVLRKYLTPDA